MQTAILLPRDNPTALILIATCSSMDPSTVPFAGHAQERRQESCHSKRARYRDRKLIRSKRNCSSERETVQVLHVSPVTGPTNASSLPEEGFDAQWPWH